MCCTCMPWYACTFLRCVSVSISVQRVTVRGAHVCVAPTRVSVLFFVVNDCIFVLLLSRLRVCDQVILVLFLEIRYNHLFSCFS